MTITDLINETQETRHIRLQVNIIVGNEGAGTCQLPPKATLIRIKRLRPRNEEECACGGRVGRQGEPDL